MSPEIPPYRILVPDRFTQEVIFPLLTPPPLEWHKAVRRASPLEAQENPRYCFSGLKFEVQIGNKKVSFGLVSVDEEGSYWGLARGVYILTGLIIDDEPQVNANRTATRALGAKALEVLGLTDVSAIVSLAGWLGEKGVEGERIASVLSLESFLPPLLALPFEALEIRGFFPVQASSVLASQNPPLTNQFNAHR